ncbi:integral membrane sensor signal transduction histidine kinase [Fictibacillus macauensis ZFHKF-1]|uniref:histidine kinase n=1 Tax=Fictibacillus macauensis ZFHKF-1 TaxID=1196324 RepID=I8AL11_9BACL|nr:ATP-binding protein [Fictibacillus macauensis]EIT86289.1 integral membrane sensor signal transduction histidine kinase [Fictibacillus macauensis ZFHKF-1]
MKINVFSRFNYFKKMNLIDRTQWRLTMIYTGLLLLFLLLFMAIVYTSLYGLIVANQEHSLTKLASQEAKSAQGKISKGRTPSIQNFFMLSQEQFFYYVVDEKGEYQAGDEVYHQMRPQILKRLKGWEPKEDEIRYEKMNATYYVPWVEDSDSKKVDLMITGQKLYKNGKYLGTFYTGKSITHRTELFSWLLKIFLVVLAVFSVVAVYISYFMSKRAIKPIIRSYMKQREFTADASHELRTPLSVVLSSINALEMEKPLKEDEFSASVLSNMKYEVKRMIQLVGDLLTLARSDADQDAMTKEVFDLKKEAEIVIHSLETLAAEKAITIKLTPEEGLYVYGNKQRLDQLLYILLENAMKYSPECKCVEVHLAVERQEFGKILVISVKDEGIGIHPEDRERIFERFYRVDKSRSKQLGGHGLGLSIAKWIVASHNGTITADGQVGKGTTFTIKIPQ